MNEELFKALGLNVESAKEKAFTQGLLGSIFQAAALSGPQARPVGNLQGLGQIGLAGMGAYESSFDKTLQDAIKGLQVKDLLEKRKEAEQIRRLAPQLFQTTRAPAQTIYDVEGETTIPGAVTGVSVNRELLPALGALGPAGMQYATQVSEFAKSLQPKTSVQSIFNEKGQEVKVRYNEDTGQYSPIGGAKAEPFVQVDRGNVIELRRPSGDIVGTVPKGAAPVAPSFSMTESGQVLNTRTGQVFQPTDAQGNPIVIDQSAKATEGERLSSGFFMRMADATSTFNQPITGLDGKPIIKDGKKVTIEDVSSRPELVAEFVGAVLPKWMGGQALKQQLTTAVREQYEQAQENWVTANLRKESGAVIGPEEMQKEIRKWFPVVGNSEKVIEQKRKSRIVAEDSMRRNAGRALATQPSQQRNINVDF
jgi:hypothetical protein